MGAFRTYFNMFLNGDAPDTITPTARRLFETDPAVERMTEAERESWRQQINRIFYSS